MAVMPEPVIQSAQDVAACATDDATVYTRIGIST